MALGLTDPKEREKAIQEAFTTFLDNVDKALGLLEAKNAKMTEPKGSKDSRKEERMQLFLKEVEATRAEFAQAKVVADQKQAAAAQKAGNIEARAA